MQFTKMQALSNDYIYIQTITQNIDYPDRWARFLSDRHCGIGSDGLVLICQSEVADFRMRIFNPDGSEAEMCGNAIRSTAKYAYSMGYTNKKELTIETLGGIKKLYLDVENNKIKMITAKLDAPVFDAEKIPVILPDNMKKCIDYPVNVHDREFRITAISMGNPHCATFIDDTKTIDLQKYGSVIENHAMFPKKANVHFATVIDKKNLFMRAWERNCGETLACGTGCCVSVTSGFITGRCSNDVTVNQIGGNIHIYLNEDLSDIYMSGNSEFVCSGDVTEENLFNYERKNIYEAYRVIE
ncbi:MAG: diaminopimelate epimerase [Clostridiales bacterium GWF2_38_85]|nr:MAG: diaminopimelate epimerase [Clostridiales bacterium GWF2_38_85]